MGIIPAIGQSVHIVQVILALDNRIIDHGSLAVNPANDILINLKQIGEIHLNRRTAQIFFQVKVHRRVFFRFYHGGILTGCLFIQFFSFPIILINIQQLIQREQEYRRTDQCNGSPQSLLRCFIHFRIHMVSARSCDFSRCLETALIAFSLSLRLIASRISPCSLRMASR